ncbi:GyrI-like domain-containing protein [Actinotalea sp.]|uniref:GyrI-like domain-containing protein n=1 Tax=Actinotalea sp. TaxID=1872145 RepID=UPI003563D407
MANDLRRDHPGLYRAPDSPARLTVPPLAYLSVDGTGDPNEAPAYAEAVGTLFAVGYGVRALVKAAGGEVWTVMPLEGLWWADDLTAFTGRRRDEWRWRMMIAQPAVVTAELVEEARSAAVGKGRAPAGELLRFEVLEEGDALQVMHHGPYAEEGPAIEALHAAIADLGLHPSGPHHEIYLSDPRRSAPERMRTILRQPVRA